MNIARREIVGRTGAAIAACLCVLSLPAVAAEKVVLQLRWDHQFQFAGYYAAMWEGYYADAGLDVEIRSAFEPDGTFHSVTREVSEGRAQFGTGAADILVARDKGAQLVVLASIFQRSPVAFYAKAAAGLRSPADLTRLRVATRGSGGFASVELGAMLRAENIDPDLVRRQPIQGRLGLHDLAEGRADVASGFTISAGWVAKELGLTLTSLRPSTYGVDFYGEALFTNRRVIERDSTLVQRFVAASLKGWEYALVNPESVADRISREFTRVVPIENLLGFNRFQIAPVQDLIQYPLIQLGHTNPGRWRRMHEALRDAGSVETPFDAEDLIFDPDRLQRQWIERIVGIVLAALGIIAVVAIIAWICLLRRSLAERKRSESVLREQERRFRDFAEAASDWFWETDANSLVRYVSERVHLTLGREPREFVGHPVSELAVLRDPISRPDPGSDHGGPRPFHEWVYTISDRDGEPKTIRVSGVPIFDVDGNFSGYRGTATDISHLELVESELRRERDFLDAILDTVDALVVVSDPQGKIIRHNHTCETVTGYSTNELEGQFVRRRLIPPEEIEIVMHSFGELEDGRDQSFNENHWITKSGDKRLISWANAAIRNESGEIENFISTGLDITDQRRTQQELLESERRHRAVVEDQTELIFRYRVDGTLTFANDAYCKFHGYNRDRLIGADFWFLVHEDDRAEVARHLASLNRESPVRLMENRRVTNAGQVRWLQWTDRAICDSDGNVVEYQSVGRDVTDLHQAREQLRKSQAELHNVSRLSEMGQLASTLAHELSQPLTAIMNYLHAARRILDGDVGLPSAEAGETIGKALEQAVRASAIIRNLRSFVEGGTSNRSALDLNAAVQEASDLGLIGAKEDGIEVRYDFALDLPPVLADKIQIQQVILNLVRNGVEAMQNSTARALTVVTTGDRGDEVEVAISDTGSGVDEEVVDRLFQPFVTTKTAGLGIGLSISNAIVEAHGGRLWVTPHPGLGSVFHFTLPVAPMIDSRRVE